MPGLLHEYTLERVATEILGPGYRTRGLKKELRKLFVQNARETLRRIRGACRDCSSCERCTGNPEDAEEIHEIECIGVIPDAFCIVKENLDDSDLDDGATLEVVLDDGDFHTIKALEIDGSSDLSSKLDRWIDFGWWVDGTDKLFLELTIVSLHGQIIGKYTDQDFCVIFIHRMCEEVRNGLVAGPVMGVM